ncbi:MAG TPA: HAMP domain-containing sensor histidine kinase [Ktedonobacterales bacterium]|nr:HAMP domain-containing sensor histidine kinase [Ktedonobacterales bacterium]
METPGDIGEQPLAGRRAVSAFGPRWRLRLGVRWLGITIGAIALALLASLFGLHPPAEHMKQLALYLAATGAVSILLGEAALWIADVTHFGSVRFKLAIPPLLTALVIALNVVLLASQMFISVEDGRLLLVFLFFGILIAIALSASIAGEMARAIAHIETGARRVAQGDYTFRVDEGGRGSADEISSLARWFNAMAANVQDAFARRQAAEADRRQVVVALSHDLRTPLSSIRALIEAIDDGVVTDPDTVRRYQRTIRAEAQHLSVLLDDLFELSRLDAGALALMRERLHIEDVLSDVLESLGEQAERAGIQLDGDIEPGMPACFLDPRQMYRVLINLLQNAIYHTPPGGAILLRAGLQRADSGERALLVQVIDGGVGIAASDLPHIFERTYRGEASRRRAATSGDVLATGSGAGLGLAIARGVVEAHGGHIWAVSPLPPDLRPLALAAEEERSGAALCFTLPAD